jgi:uncharacterized phage protein (TIGR02220 family)
MLSVITNTNVDIVRQAIKIFSSLGLMELLEDRTIYMTETSKMLGYETDWAKKKREQRSSKQIESGDNVPSMSLQSPNNVLQEKERDIELDLEKDKKETKKDSIPFSKIMDYLNQKANKTWKHTSTIYVKNVRARFNEGFAYEDFIKAIDNAYNHWSKSGSLENMHPKTLFNTDFERRVTNDAYGSFKNKETKTKSQEALESGKLKNYFV